MVKLSPMQDISECVTTLKGIKEVYVISVKNEIKELLLIINKDYKENPIIHAVDLSKTQENSFTHDFSARHAQVEFSKSQDYIYQPGASLIKSELQNLYNAHLGIAKLHPNTHLYTSNDLVNNYFGRVFRVRETVKLNKKGLHKILKKEGVNVISKNFPLSASEIVKKYNLKIGGDLYLIAFTNHLSEKESMICERIY